MAERSERWRKIYPHMWTDAKVRQLSRIPPCGQGLWVHLLAGEHTGIIPGLSRIGESALAEQLGWSLEGFRESFREGFQLGLVKADWEARLVWLPNGIKWNPPANPNIIKSWSIEWQWLPDCELKLEVWQEFKRFLEGLGEGFASAFVNGCRKPEVNQRAESREQKEVKTDTTIVLAKRTPKPKEPPTEIAQIRRTFRDGYAARYSQEYHWGAKHSGQAKHLLQNWPLAVVLDLIPKFFAWQRPDIIKGGHSWGNGATSFVFRIDELYADTHTPERRDIAAAIHESERDTGVSAYNRMAGAEVLRGLLNPNEPKAIEANNDKL